MPSPTDIYGELYEVGTVKRKRCLTGHGNFFIEPNRRFVGFSRGQSVEVYDTAPEKPGPVASHRRVLTTSFARVALHPDGQHIVVRDRNAGTLKRYGGDGLQCTVQTDTARVAAVGVRAVAGEERPFWKDAGESVWFSADGKSLVLTTHSHESKPVVMLFDAKTLTLIDTIGDLTYHTEGWDSASRAHTKLEEPLFSWGGFSLSPDPIDPEVLMGTRSAGDNWDGIFALRVAGGQVSWLAPQALAEAVRDVSHYALYGLGLLPGDGLMVMDLDQRVTRLVWPPDPDAPREATTNVWDFLREAPLRWLEQDYILVQEAVTVTSRHILVTVARDSLWTMGFVALDPHTLRPLGGVRRPWSRASYSELESLGNDLFATQGRTVTTLWRLRVSESAD